jgi:hypothetical protein
MPAKIAQSEDFCDDKLSSSFLGDRELLKVTLH